MIRYAALNLRLDVERKREKSYLLLVQVEIYPPKDGKVYDFSITINTTVFQNLYVQVYPLDSPHVSCNEFILFTELGPQCCCKFSSLTK